MENVKIKNLHFTDDIDLAEKVIQRKVTSRKGTFNGVSSIYRVTNETISGPDYFDRMKDRKKVLAVTGSGDQLINSILAGAKDIKSYDISIFPKYFVALKLAAIKALNREEFLEYMIGDIYNKQFPLNSEYYNRIRNYLDDKSKRFWDRIFVYYREEELYYSPLFNSFNLTKSRVVNSNPYLQGNNYELLKSKLDDVSIELSEGDLFETNLSNLNPVDLALLTNLINYIAPYTYKRDEIVRKYKEFLDKIPLSENGIALTYNFVFDGPVKDLFTESNYKISTIDEKICLASVENEIIEYTKKKKLSFNFFRRK